MRTFVLLLLASLLAPAAWPQSFTTAQTADVAELSGTPIVAALLTNLSSLTTRTGDPVRFRVLEDVLSGDRKVVIPKGATLVGVVSEAHRLGWKGFHLVRPKISIAVTRAEWEGGAVSLDADLFGFITDSGLYGYANLQELRYAGEFFHDGQIYTATVPKHLKGGKTESIDGHAALTLRQMDVLQIFAGPLAHICWACTVAEPCLFELHRSHEPGSRSYLTNLTVRKDIWVPDMPDGIVLLNHSELR